MKIQVFWDVTPCRLVNSYRHFEEGIILELLDPEDEGAIFLRNVGTYLPVYTT
jgi:hypothetical protein